MPTENKYNQPIGFPIKNWDAIKKPSIENMVGTYCILERLNIEKHAKHLYHSFSCLKMTAPHTLSTFDTYDDFCFWLSETLALEDTVLYAILNIETRLPIGIAGFLRINPEHGVIEVGHLHFSKLLEKTPAATESMYLMMQYVFDELQYRRYEWKCDSFKSTISKCCRAFWF